VQLRRSQVGEISLTESLVLSNCGNCGIFSFKMLTEQQQQQQQQEKQSFTAIMQIDLC